MKQLELIANNLRGKKSVAIGIVNDGNIKHSNLGPLTKFHIASTQKAITSMFIATLVDDKLVDWDTKLNTLLPKFKLDVSMKELLSMNSGISASYDDIDEDTTPESLFKKIKLSRPKFAYSNYSYSLAGYAGALIAGEKWGNLQNGYIEQLKKRVLEPLGMFTNEVTFKLDALAPSGCMVTSINNMLCFLTVELNNGYSNTTNKQVVSKTNMKMRWKSLTKDGFNYYGMGWVNSKFLGKNYLSHNGDFAGFNSIIAMIPEENRGLVVLTNSSDDILIELLDYWLMEK